MATNFDFDPLFDMSLQARLKRFAIRVINTRYFFYALLIHIVVLVIFGGKVVFEAIQAKEDFNSEGEFLVVVPSRPLPPPVVSPPGKAFEVKISVKPLERTMTLISIQKLSTEFHVPPPEIPVVVPETLTLKTDEKTGPKIDNIDLARLAGVQHFHEGGVIGAGGKLGATGRGKQTVAKFTCYVAQYTGGDWDCNFGKIAEDRWYGNCIYNLMQQINRWTHGRVNAELKPEALKLSNREWIDKIKPPFIFITGHQDFTFNETEVQNLREYLMLGGALWVDNSLPGRGSRFDIALRREMKKVLPDRDFEPIDNSHPVFRECFNLQGPPDGMNFYKEPVEVIKIGGEVAVFYTLNSYSDLWETALTPKDEVDLGVDWSPSLRGSIGRWGPHYNHPYSGEYVFATQYSYNYLFNNAYHFFRNVNRESIVTAYQFGINIVIHLITRFQDKFMMLPRSEGGISR